MFSSKPEKFLHPGDFYFSRSGQMGTLLGSCIAMVLWHPILKIGGMCHFVLPECHGHGLGSGDLNGRYAIDAMELFRRAARSENTRLKEYQGMIYGGGNVVAALACPDNDSIGMRNASTAMDLLTQEKVAIMIVDVGETWSRRISFDIASGEVAVKRQGTLASA